MDPKVRNLPHALPAGFVVDGRDDETACFLHPSYPSPLDLLFTLPCVDPRNERGALTLHHNTALLACQIVADNAFSGRLFFDREGTSAVEDKIPIHGLLPPGTYFFMVNSDPTYRYPVVPTFRDWRFPHGQLPETWPNFKNLGFIIPPPRCAVTNHYFGVTTAHLVPREEEDWFMLNGMVRYCLGTRDINDFGNIIRLRADIHRCFDDRMFSIVPKPMAASNGPDSPSSARVETYVLHVFSSNAEEFSAMHHDKLIRYLGTTSRELLFARFAWTVFVLVKPFVLGRMDRSVAIAAPGVQWVRKELSGLELLSLYGGDGSRSAGPGNSSRWRDERPDSLSDPDRWYRKAVEEDRGRKRTRRDDQPGIPG